ncbi:MAG: ABC transporter permease [Bacteroidetes bacterium]|nr:ABC transporter permease [Bacteroidota bacterium]
MQKVFTLAKWEFFEKVRKKSFLIYMFVFPALIISLGLLPKLIDDNTEEYTKTIGIVDATGKFKKAISNKLDIITLPNQQPRYVTVIFGAENKEDNIEAADFEIKRGTLDGYLLIESENGNFKYQFRSRQISGFIDLQFLESALNEVITEYNLEKFGIPSENRKGIIGNVNISSVQINENGINTEKDFLDVFFDSYILLMLLAMTIIFSGGTFVRSLINEKNNGVLEVILSSLNVDQLLTGKILGLIYLSLFQFLIWGILGYFLSQNSILFTYELSQNFILQLIYFILGYVLFISIFVGLGSISATEQGAQQTTGIVTIILVFPIVIASVVIQNPGSLLSQILTYFPLTTPSMQMLKLNFYSPSIWEISATIIILLTSIYFVIKFSSKLFKVGVLHFDQQTPFKILKRIFQ